MAGKNNNKKEKSNRGSSQKTDIVKVCAFWGILVAALLFVVRGVLGLFDLSLGGTIMNILDLIGKLALLIAVALPAYSFVRGKAKVWKTVYWVALVVYIAGCVLGLIQF